jgi:hypothetical protein
MWGMWGEKAYMAHLHGLEGIMLDGRQELHAYSMLQVL